MGELSRPPEQQTAPVPPPAATGEGAPAARTTPEGGETATNAAIDHEMPAPAMDRTGAAGPEAAPPVPVAQVTATAGTGAAAPSATSGIRSAPEPGSGTGEPAAPPGETKITAEDGALLLRAAVGTIAARLGGPPFTPPPASGRLDHPGACFVTLYARGRLRGCLGTLEPTRSLYDDVIHNAERAMTDPRLPPVTIDDWPWLDVTVSVLTDPVPLAVASRADLVASLRPGVDGVILDDGRRRRVTFLPAVWSKLPDADRFVGALLAKGGWSPHGWPHGIAVWRYLAVEYLDPAPRGPLDKAG